MPSDAAVSAEAWQDVVVTEWASQLQTTQEEEKSATFYSWNSFAFETKHEKSAKEQNLLIWTDLFLYVCSVTMSIGWKQASLLKRNTRVSPAMSVT